MHGKHLNNGNFYLFQKSECQIDHECSGEKGGFIYYYYCQVQIILLKKCSKHFKLL